MKTKMIALWIIIIGFLITGASFFYFHNGYLSDVGIVMIVIGIVGWFIYRKKR